MSNSIKRWGWVFVMLLVPGLEITCQTTAIGARSASLAGISACLEDAWAAANNPAGMARYNYLSLAITIEQRYQMKELGHYALAGTVPAGSGCLGISTTYSGFQSFIDQMVSIGYGRLFGEHVMPGIGLVYVYQKAGSEARPVHQLSYSLGAIVILSKKVNLAIAAFNPFQLYYKNQDYATLPAIIKMGMSVQYSQAFIIHTELEKDLDLPPCFKIGLEYAFKEKFFIRGGIKGFPAAYSFGAAMRHQRFLFEFSSGYHQYLGFTPQFSLQFDFK